MRTGLARAAALAVVAGGATADVRLPRILGSNMVLQREKPVRIWGWAEKGEASPSPTPREDFENGEWQWKERCSRARSWTSP
jgi:sialate O-acetylesterase